MLQDKGSLPQWLHKPLRGGGDQTEKAVRKCGLCTVCEEALCPNLAECFHEKRATFLLLGSHCTRSCSFCSVGFSKSPQPPDPQEPKNIAECCAELGLLHVVLTMVTRDDLLDGGASHVANAIRAVREKLCNVTVEVLTSDFGGSLSAIETVLDEKPEVFAHNLETVRSLCPKIRYKATYDGSLDLLQAIKKKNPSQATKSSIMVGLGETCDEVIQTLKDLACAGVDMVTIGQYLQPTSKQIAVTEWVSPEMFQQYELRGKELGIGEVLAGPFVRSSYKARPIQRTK
jgi:lipoyl synthase